MGHRSMKEKTLCLKNQQEVIIETRILMVRLSPLVHTDNALSSALLSSGKALSSGQNPASQQFLLSKSSQ